MKRAEIREFIRQGVVAITPSVEFDSGLLTDFNSQRAHIYPKVWLESPSTKIDYPASAPINDWNIKLYIASLDRMDSAPAIYEDLVDQADYIAQQLLYQYRTIISGYKLLAIEGTSREAWIKKNADCLTGVVLSFNLKGPDQTDVCVDD